MTRKLFSLILAVAVACSLGTTAAIADTGGHFTSSANHTTIIGEENSTHRIHFSSEGAPEEGWSGCDRDALTGTVTGTTVESVTITPLWEECYTTGSPGTKFDIHENGCNFKFTIGDTGTHHTVDLTCPAGKSIEVTHPNCLTKVPPQTVTGVVYKTDVINTKHSITLEITVENITTHYHGGICIFLGTSHQHQMRGSGTVWAVNPEGLPVDITATTTP